MSYRGRAGRGVFGRLLLLLLLALGLMHLLAHAGDTGTGREPAAIAHTHVIQSEPTTAGEAAPPVATASVEHDHRSTEDATELGLCAAVIGCCTLPAIGSRRLRRRLIASRLLLSGRAAWPRPGRPPRPTFSHGVGIAQLAVLRI